MVPKKSLLVSVHFSEDGESYSVSAGERIIADTIASILPPSELHCAYYCYQMPTCDAFNFNRRTMQCELLLEANSVSEVETTNDGSWTHYEVTG